MDRIYLDNAATSWPKPESVYRAVDKAMRLTGSAAGRGSSRNAIEATQLVDQTRGMLAELINADDQSEISFTFNGTDALSTAILGMISEGDHVVTTELEHNSVLRPLNHLVSKGVITTTTVNCDDEGNLDMARLVNAVQHNTRLVCLSHASNVTGAIQQTDGLKSKLANKGSSRIRLLLDAAQSAGHLPIDVQKIGCDLLATSGHKGLLGPLGTGFLFVKSDFAEEVAPLRFGGTGTAGSIEFQPDRVPEKFEAGNPNVPGIAGLNAGVKFLRSDEGITSHENWIEQSTLLLEGLQTIENLTVHGPSRMSDRVGVFSVAINRSDSREVAAILDSSWSIQARAGIHCAPLIHRRLQTERAGGTLRLSPGRFTTSQEIETAVDAIRELAENL